jgi:hypothetical protein
MRKIANCRLPMIKSPAAASRDAGHHRSATRTLKWPATSNSAPSLSHHRPARYSTAGRNRWPSVVMASKLDGKMYVDARWSALYPSASTYSVRWRKTRGVEAENIALDTLDVQGLNLLRRRCWSRDRGRSIKLEDERIERTDQNAYVRVYRNRNHRSTCIW